MNASPQAVRNRNLRTLAVLAALFLLPLAFAFLTYYGTDWRPVGHVNHGTLIEPARPLPAVTLPTVLQGEAGRAFHGEWSLVYLGSGACDADCRAALYLMRQTRVALNTDMTRVARVMLVTAECCASEFLAREYPGLTVLDASAESAAGLLREFPQQARAHTVYIVDPLGNLMMSYDARQNPHGLLEDLKKLLRLSQIG
jgi:hypothetical protein